MESRPGNCTVVALLYIHYKLFLSGDILLPVSQGHEIVVLEPTSPHHRTEGERKREGERERERGNNWLVTASKTVSPFLRFYFLMSEMAGWVLFPSPASNYF